MPLEITERNLVGLLRSMVRNAITEGQAAVRVTRVLSGVVEDLDTDLDVVYVRMDQEANSSDPTMSNNWGMPGVIPTTRVGETFVGEQVRVSFDGKAGATSNRTSIPSKIVLPYGTETGQRIELHGETGTIEFYDDNDLLVGFFDSTQWFLGIPGQSLARLDPLGGLRLRDSNDILRAQLSATEGLILREATTGVSGLTAGSDGIVVIDPSNGDRISITSGTTSAVPSPHWAGDNALNPGVTHGTPAVASFLTGDDLDLRFVCASVDSDLGTQSYTPPSTFTEHTDQNSSGSGITLATSSASLNPAVTNPGIGNFANTSSGWTRRNGHSIVIQGPSPAFRSSAVLAPVTTTDQFITAFIQVPAGAVAGDILVAFVAMASSQVPVGWTVPEGFKQLGVQVAGLGTPHLLASGIWYKRRETGDPSSYSVTINMSAAGLTKLQATTIAVQTPYAFPAGLDIRRNNRSMPRGNIAQVESTSDTAIWNNGQLSQNLEQITGMSVFGGRKYDISYSTPITEFVPNAGFPSGIVEFVIEIDESGNGSAWTTFHKTQFRVPTGVFRGAINLRRRYIPASNLTLGTRFWVVNALSGAGYTIQLFGSGDYRRVLSVDDIGAEF